MDNLTLDEILVPVLSEPVSRVLKAQSSNFGHLVSLTNLDHRFDFRHSDLRGVDFSNTNLIGFDFTGCDLRGCVGVSVKWNTEQTVLNDAILDNSLFHYRYSRRHDIANVRQSKTFEQLRRSTWTEQTIWITKHVRKGAEDFAKNRLIAMSMFDFETTSFVKGELIKSLEKSSLIDPDEFKLFLIDIINFHIDDHFIVRRCLQSLKNIGSLGEPSVFNFIESLLSYEDSRIVSIALDYILPIMSGSQEFRNIVKSIDALQTSAIYQTIMKQTASRLGEVFEFIARNPITNDYRTYPHVEENEYLVVLRNLCRTILKESIRERREGVTSEFIQTFGKQINLDHFAQIIDALSAQMPHFGLERFIFPPLTREMKQKILHDLDYI